MGGGGARRFKLNFECTSFHAILVLHKNARASSNACVPGRRSRRSKDPKRHKLIFHLVFFSFFFFVSPPRFNQTKWSKSRKGRKKEMALVEESRHGEKGKSGD